MQNLIQTILNLLKSLFGGSSTSSPASDDCAIFDIEIPADYDLDEIPLITVQSQAAENQDFSAQALTKSCQIQVRPGLGRINVRGGPRLAFGPVAQANGGVFLDLIGASEADPDGYRWYNVKTPSGINGWVRGDVVIIGEDCLTFTFITEADLSPPEPPQVTDRFVLPSAVRINLGYSSTHRGLDLNTAYGTPIRASAPGIIIRRIICENCAKNSRPNIFPCGTAILNSKAWGYGYGNFVIVRHDFAVLPPTLRATMASKGLERGFAYVLYAHFSELNVDLGQAVIAGDLLGLTGNHGCSSAPHLHFEIRMGKDEIVDGRWLNQTPVNPNLMFKV